MAVSAAKEDSTSAKINLTFLNGTGYVFNADDYMQLRTEHRIIGTFVGTCNSRGWSASAHALPAELTQYETKLLLEKGIAVLLSKTSDLLAKLNGKEKEVYLKLFESRINEQEETLKAEKIRESEKNMDRIIAGKRRKLLKSGVAESEVSLNRDDVVKEIGDNLVFDRNNALLEIHCEHPWPHDAQILQLPPDTSLKYRVFRHFWEQGRFVTSGETFGADFLIYPGDPMLFHASHIIILLDKPAIKPLDLIAKVRLSVVVNKICVFAYLATNDNGLEEICYQSVVWDGNRDKDKARANLSDS